MSPLFGSKKDGGGSAEQRARSAADREAARLERERRRAEREGRPLPPEPAGPAAADVEPAPPVHEPEPAPPAYEAQPEPETHAEPEPPVYEPDPPAHDEPEPEPPVYEPDPPAYEPEPAAYEPEPADYEPVTQERESRTYEASSVAAAPSWLPAEDPATQVHALPADPAPQLPADGETPAGVRRVPAPSVRDLPQIAGARAAGPVPAGRRGRVGGGGGGGGGGAGAGGGGGLLRSGPRRRRRGARGVGALLLLLIVVAIGYFAFRVFQPTAGTGDAKRPVVVTIPQGATAGQIGDQLAKAGVIDSSFFFGLRSRLSGKRADLKAGRFTLKRDMSYTAALDALTQNPAAAPTVKVTIPEGRSIREAATVVAGSGLSGSYVKAATRNPRTVTGLKSFSVPKGTTTLEGFLFPATYELKRGATTATARKLADEQLSAFRANYRGLDRRAARRKHLTDYDVLIIASMIEREAGVSKDRPLISAVIYNRLKDRMPLGIDATLRYHLNNWSRPLKQSELQQDSPFNTRTRQGLPPTPIGSPGLASIKAALAPANVPYLYYVVKPCGNGAHAFSASNAQFTKDVAAYNKKRAQLGGKDPSHC
ncbi:MAG: hypothetical protein QOF26_3156 [Baekduia sp.]|nr:hypothetical protein [Baekduia sp.]